MKIYNKIFTSTLVLVFLCGLAFAQEEKVTLTTYYPAPYGDYQEIRLVGTQIPQFTGATKGMLSLEGAYTAGYYSAIDFCYNTGAPPSARIAAYHDGSGSKLMFGTSNNYSTGITNTAMTIDQNAYVGIGTTQPGTKLEIAGSEQWTTALRLNNTLSNTKWRIAAGSAGDSNMPANGLAIHRDSIGTSMAFASNGNVGIGTITPQSKLDINGGLRVGSGQGGVLTCAQPGNYGGRELILTVADGAGGSADEIWIGPNTGAYQGHISLSAAQVNVAGTLFNYSDIRLKKDISPITNALDKVMSIRGVKYRLKDKMADKSMQMGVIAQEVEKVFPDAVISDKKGIKSVAYNQLIAVLIEAVKEQQKEINQLKSEINKLKVKSK